jgi:hypothetical protein
MTDAAHTVRELLQGLERCSESIYHHRVRASKIRSDTIGGGTRRRRLP